MVGEFNLNELLLDEKCKQVEEEQNVAGKSEGFVFARLNVGKV